MNSFDTYAKNLDSIAANLPTFGQYLQNGAYAHEIFADFTEELKNILKYLKAEDIEDFKWHRNVAPVKFKPTKSPYFRLGKFGKFENVPVNEDLEAVIAIGFDEDGEYEDDENPELVIYYINDDFCSDIDLYKPKNWRNALNEFFDMSKVK